MSERFIKFIPSEEALYLLKHKGHAFRLLTIIASTCRMHNNGVDGLKIGECFIGGHENYDMTESNYRTAKKILIDRGHIEIVETCRTRKKSDDGNTTIGTKVKILSTCIFDLNINLITTDFDAKTAKLQKIDDLPDDPINDRFSLEKTVSIDDRINDPINDRSTTDSRPTHDKQRMNKNDKNDHHHHPYPSSSKVSAESDDDDDDDESFFDFGNGVKLSKGDYAECLKAKGTEDAIRTTIEELLAWPNRKCAITNWKSAIVRWKSPKKKVSTDVYRELVERLEATNRDVKHSTISVYHDNIKGVIGALFESCGAATKPYFISFEDEFFIEKLKDGLKQYRLKSKIGMQ